MKIYKLCKYLNKPAAPGANEYRPGLPTVLSLHSSVAEARAAAVIDNNGPLSWQTEDIYFQSPVAGVDIEKPNGYRYAVYEHDLKSEYLQPVAYLVEIDEWHSEWCEKQIERTLQDALSYCERDAARSKNRLSWNVESDKYHVSDTPKKQYRVTRHFILDR